jgi:histone deacetylase complex regulatory component SIN3
VTESLQVNDIARPAKLNTNQDLDPEIERANAYIDEIKAIAGPLAYRQFLDAMKDFKERKNVRDTVQLVRQALAGHEELIAGFSKFLPRPKPLTAEYLSRAAATLKNHPELCQQLNRIIWQQTKREIDANTTRDRVNDLLANYPSLHL